AMTSQNLRKVDCTCSASGGMPVFRFGVISDGPEFDMDSSGRDDQPPSLSDLTGNLSSTGTSALVTAPAPGASGLSVRKRLITRRSARFFSGELSPFASRRNNRETPQINGMDGRGPL